MLLSFLAHLIAKYVLSSLNIGSGGTKFEMFREHVTYAGPDYLIRTVCKVRCTNIIFIFVQLSFGDAIALL